MRKAKDLYTIGYSGHTIQSFLDSLKERQIDTVLDIRMMPLSRKKGFSKTSLGFTLESTGINYCHVRSLGSPKILRERLYVDKDYQRFFSEYRDYLLLQEQGLSQAAELISSHRVCLMCVEECHTHCHRSIVADEVAKYMHIPLLIQHVPSTTAVLS